MGGNSGNVGVDMMYSSWYNFMMYFDGSRQPVMHDYPLNFIVPGSAVVLYLLMVWLLPKWMKNREPFEFPILLRLWNLFMSVLALCMLVGLAGPILLFALKNYQPLVDPLHTAYMLTCAPDMKIW